MRKQTANPTTAQPTLFFKPGISGITLAKCFIAGEKKNSKLLSNSLDSLRDYCKYIRK
jgi:hypothetical protein